MTYQRWDTVSSYLVDNLYERINNGEFPEGSKLPSEQKLCEEYTVGRSSVREALRILQAKNAIVIERGKGSFVLSADKKKQLSEEWYKSKTEQLEDLLDLRVALECMAVRKAVKVITEEDIHKLEEINDHFISMSKIKDYNGLQKCDEDFHFQIVKVLKFELLEQMFNQLEEVYAEYRIKGFILTNYTDQAAEGHERLIEAIRGRDAEMAAREMERHVKECLSHVRKILAIMETDE